ncbi:MAG: SulP family inorganic anion transporter [Burkholderiaceae bacterium]
MIALLEAHKAGLYARRHWAKNLVAGVIVGVVALPLAMAFAIASGARPEQGLYTAIIGGGMVTLFGGSRVQIAGPTGAFIAILAGITAKYGIDGLQVATFMAGCMLVLMGVARMGGVIKFIPAPVIDGFTAGIGVIIFVGQWRDFLGLPAVGGEYFHLKLWHLLQVMPQVHWPTAGLACLSLALVVFGPRIRWIGAIPGPLTAMVVATALQATLKIPGVATIGSTFGGIPTGLPAFHLPGLSFTQIVALLGPAVTIAMLGSIESLLSAVVADGMAGTKHNSNQELIGQGIANIFTPLFGGFAATGAIARTATNIRNGANSPLAGIAHALTLVAVLLFLAPLASSIPLAALAAILFVVAWNMSQVKHFTRMLQRAPMADRAILLVTFLLTVFSDLVVAVNVGVLLAVLHFLRRMSQSVEVHPSSDDSLMGELERMGQDKLPPGVLVYEISGPLFFGAVEKFERALMDTHALPHTLILRLNEVPFMDITGIQTLEGVITDLRAKKVTVLLCEANQRVLTKLRNAKVLSAEEGDGYFTTLRGALVRAQLGQPAEDAVA